MIRDQWFKSSYSGNTDNSCVEVYFDGETVKIRDTKDREAGTLNFTREEWTAFVAGMHSDEFNLL